MINKKLTLGHSPDPDDAFMFYGMASGLVDCRGYNFEHILRDIQTLNEWAMAGRLDISAISFHAYPYVADNYALLPCGASMGDGYGPIIVAKKRLSKDEIIKSRIAIPGKLTSAFLALQLYLNCSEGELNCVVVPFDQIFETVLSGKADAGLVIHEGQLTFSREGLVVCEDLGVWWKNENDNLPLPLGGNVIHKRIPSDERKVISAIIKESIQFSLNHRDGAVKYALQFGRGLDLNLADKFIGMYVNHWTVDYGERGRESIRRFLKKAEERGLIPKFKGLEFVG
ncbi:MAG: ABC transporter substrate-binding protein [Verrucomicrobiae bacterium]|nr:ABC transporter substrate-binding protein [Verrucomicrobiae bacterium]